MFLVLSCGILFDSWISIALSMKLFLYALCQVPGCALKSAVLFIDKHCSRRAIISAYRIPGSSLCFVEWCINHRQTSHQTCHCLLMLPAMFLMMSCRKLFGSWTSIVLSRSLSPSNFFHVPDYALKDAVLFIDKYCSRQAIVSTYCILGSWLCLVEWCICDPSRDKWPYRNS